ncbi:hypothetical protein [Haloactinopolyspora sp.]|uniref:hypothetical protein n=1 Tax=Haloactinopolyspora sp. TaxID=1966353 RepID=UPI002617E263|nr:hypothetical protein [Haloactinopolyspora sp.]
MKFAVRRRVLVAVPVAVALGLAGCSIHEQTQGWYEPANGVSTETDDLLLRNVLVVADDTGRATLIASVSNEGADDDELVEVVVGDATAQPAEGPIEIPSNGYATIGPDAERIDFDDTDAEPGHTIDVEFRFARSSRASVEALVMEAKGDFADALPEEQATPGLQETPGGQETPGTTETPGAEETPGNEETPGTAG